MELSVVIQTFLGGLKKDVPLWNSLSARAANFTTSQIQIRPRITNYYLNAFDVIMYNVIERFVNSLEAENYNTI